MKVFDQENKGLRAGVFGFCEPKGLVDGQEAPDFLQDGC
jgi:hypothetical protein